MAIEGAGLVFGIGRVLKKLVAKKMVGMFL